MKVSGQLVIAGCDAPPVLEASKHALDKVAAFIGIAIERLEVLAGRVVWNDRRGSAFDQKVSKPVCVTGGVCRADARRRQRLQQRLGLNATGSCRSGWWRTSRDRAAQVLATQNKGTGRGLPLFLYNDTQALEIVVQLQPDHARLAVGIALSRIAGQRISHGYDVRP